MDEIVGPMLLFKTEIMNGRKDSRLSYRLTLTSLSSNRSIAKVKQLMKTACFNIAIVFVGLCELIKKLANRVVMATECQYSQAGKTYTKERSWKA
jgi:hypothetical protein